MLYYYPKGFTIITYDLYKNINRREIVDCFYKMTKEEYEQLNIGDEYWYDAEPYHANGKVYGFTKRFKSDEKISYDRLYKLIDKDKFTKLIMNLNEGML